MKAVLLLICLLPLINSCGEKKNKSKKTVRYERITQSMINDIMSNQKFECDSLSLNGCPEGIVRIVTLDQKNPEKSKLCSGTMISKDLMLTNHHCIENQLDCNNSHLAIYDGNFSPKGYQRAKCLEVIYSEQDHEDPNNPERIIDVAIVRIDKPYIGNPHEMSYSNINPNQNVNLWVVDHTGVDKEDFNFYDSRITQLECVVLEQDYFKSTVLSKCPVIGGNSGSAVFNESNEIVGVVWGSNATFNSRMELEERRSLNEIIGTMTDIGYFRHLAKKDLVTH